MQPVKHKYGGLQTWLNRGGDSLWPTHLAKTFQEAEIFAAKVKTNLRNTTLELGGIGGRFSTYLSTPIPACNFSGEGWLTTKSVGARLIYRLQQFQNEGYDF